MLRDRFLKKCRCFQGVDTLENLAFRASALSENHATEQSLAHLFHALCNNKGIPLEPQLGSYLSALYFVLMLRATWYMCLELLQNSLTTWSFLVSPSKLSLAQLLFQLANCDSIHATHPETHVPISLYQDS